MLIDDPYCCTVIPISPLNVLNRMCNCSQCSLMGRIGREMFLKDKNCPWPSFLWGKHLGEFWILSRVFDLFYFLHFSTTLKLTVGCQISTVEKHTIGVVMRAGKVICQKRVSNVSKQHCLGITCYRISHNFLHFFPQKLFANYFSYWPFQNMQWIHISVKLHFQYWEIIF